MTLSDLLPTSDQLAGLQGIERSLLQRRRNGAVLSTALAIGAAVLQAALLLSHIVPLPEKGKALTWGAIAQALRGPEAAVFGVIILAIAVWLAIRYTGFPFQESKEPFQYTFCIQPFARVQDTPGDRFSLAHEDVLKLMHYDLRERLNRRIGRLWLLDHPAQAEKPGEKPADAKLRAHIHVEGDYAVRKEKDGGWVLHVLCAFGSAPTRVPSRWRSRSGIRSKRRNPPRILES